MSLKPFVSIPGPRALPLIGTLYKYLPFVGEYSFKHLYETGQKKYVEYGPLVRENLVGDVNLLLVYDPTDIQEVFVQDGKYPMRRSHIALKHYRLSKPEMYSSGGLLPENGEQWYQLRSESQKVMSRLQCVRSLLPLIDQICSEFVSLVDSSRDEQTGEIGDFLEFLKKVFLEATFAVSLDVRVGCLSPQWNKQSEAYRLLNAAESSVKSIIKTDNGLQLWRWFQTPLYRQLSQGQDTIYKIAQKYVDLKEEELKVKYPSAGGPSKDLSSPEDNDNRSLTTLEYFLLKSSLSKKDILTVTCDSLLAGTDTSSYTTAFILYHLSKNLSKQKILSEEASRLLRQSGGEVTPHVLNEARYARAVLKESLRLNPVSIGVGRIASKDFNLRGYLIPEGTVIVTQNQVTSQLEEHVSNPGVFLPERWLNRQTLRHPYTSIPFGHGPRSCIGRRIAEQNILTLLLKLFDKFNVVWTGKPNLGCVSNLLNEPDSELKFIFKPKDHL